MGFLDFLGGSSPEKAMKLKAKVTQKYGDPASRQKAIQHGFVADQEEMHFGMTLHRPQQSGYDNARASVAAHRIHRNGQFASHGHPSQKRRV